MGKKNISTVESYIHSLHICTYIRWYHVYWQGFYTARLSVSVTLVTDINMLLASWQLQHRCWTLQWWLADHFIDVQFKYTACLLHPWTRWYPHRPFAQRVLTAICFCLKCIFLKVHCMTISPNKKFYMASSLYWPNTNFLIVSSGM